MYPEAVDMLAPYVKTWKVRFKDRRNIDILQKIYALNQKVLISCDEFGRTRKPNINYLFCVPEYPPTSIPDLKCFEGFDGYSCHVPVVSHIAEVVRYQKSQYLEVHVMLEYENYEPIDQKVSLTIPDLKKLVAAIRIPELYKKGRRIEITSHTDKNGGLLDDENYWI
jgi:sialic acid synthase SpsE